MLVFEPFFVTLTFSIPHTVRFSCRAWSLRATSSSWAAYRLSCHLVFLPQIYHTYIHPLLDPLDGHVHARTRAGTRARPHQQATRERGPGRAACTWGAEIE